MAEKTKNTDRFETAKAYYKSQTNQVLVCTLLDVADELTPGNRALLYEIAERLEKKKG
jgi:hypothetical protein